jgi:cobalamin biosynthesis protein CobT
MMMANDEDESSEDEDDESDEDDDDSDDGDVKPPKKVGVLVSLHVNMFDLKQYSCVFPEVILIGVVCDFYYCRLKLARRDPQNLLQKTLYLIRRLNL